MGADYLSLNSEVLNFAPTSSEGIQQQCSYIEILDDDVFEADEQFTVQLSSDNSQVTLTNAEATITIIDNDDDKATTGKSVSYYTYNHQLVYNKSTMYRAIYQDCHTF